MKKLINAVEDEVKESLAGFCAAHSDIVRIGAEAPFVLRRHLKPGKVALVSGGGSGHEPLHAGFVGQGMLDAACPGQVFTSPTPDLILAAAEAADTGGGVLFIVKNYEGDVMNFDMAREMSGNPVATVITDDDVAVEKSTFSTGRRGVAGTLIVEKIVGAAAEEGGGLAELYGACGRQADFRHRRGRDGGRGRHPWRAGAQARQAQAGCRDSGGNGQRDHRRSWRARAWRGHPVAQRLWRNAAFGALPDV